jgi:hypothetical protein
MRLAAEQCPIIMSNGPSAVMKSSMSVRGGKGLKSRQCRRMRSTCHLLDNSPSILPCISSCYRTRDRTYEKPLAQEMIPLRSTIRNHLRAHVEEQLSRD